MSHRLLDLVTITNHEAYVKLIVSCLDYSKDGLSRLILSKALTATSEVITITVCLSLIHLLSLCPSPLLPSSLLSLSPLSLPSLSLTFPHPLSLSLLSLSHSHTKKQHKQNTKKTKKHTKHTHTHTPPPPTPPPANHPTPRPPTTAPTPTRSRRRRPSACVIPQAPARAKLGHPRRGPSLRALLC